jgi:hypothetical protein
MTDRPDDRRQHPRISFQKAIYIEVVQRGQIRDTHADVMRCETVDVSVSGLKVFVPREVPANSLLNIAAHTEDWQESLELKGVSRWCAPTADKQGYWLGLELMDADSEAMHKWFMVLQRLREED